MTAHSGASGRSSRRFSARMTGLALACGTLALALMPLQASSTAAPAEALPGRAQAPATDGGFQQTRTVGREVLGADGQLDPTLSSSYKMTVTADRTTDLRGRERVQIAWRGARPSAGRAANPYGEKGLLQEYPVVVLQCRGTDDPSLPADQQVRPETCWASSVEQRSQRLRSRSEATWTVDRFADAADRELVSGMSPFPSAACDGLESTVAYTHLTEFVGADGTVYPSCAADKMAPEAGIDAAFPPSEVAAFTDLDGKGSLHFEVRSSVENESLGCSHEVACSIVVIPILGISCDTPSATMTSTERACRKTGRFAAGSSNFADEGVDQAVSPSLWWAASNWRNRFTIPVTFGLPAGVCDVLDPRAPTSFYGSELMAQAALQWAPAYCLRDDRFKFELSQMPDKAGWNNMTSGVGPAAFVSSEHPVGADPVGYAPTAVTGFGIGYVIDRPGNAGEYDRLRLNPRLIAKLLTQSYLGSDLGRGHPGIEGNPLAIMADPEFKKLNPGLSDNIQEVGAALLSLSVSSDLISQVTAYIAQDADAMAFVSGKPDPWGMRINPSYQGLELPVDEWPLLDSYVPDTQNECLRQNPSVYFTQLAAPVSTLRTIADALIDAWPNVQTRCDFDTATSAFKLGRKDRQGFGTRFMLGLVSLGDADRFGLRSAALLTSANKFVAPTDASLTAAVRLMKQQDRFGPFALSQQALVGERTAYPGTMVVYTAARLNGLPAADATNVSSFVRIATSEGQRAGRGNGDLPGGYLPLRRTGATAALWRAAQETADVIETQKVPDVPSDPGTEVPGGPGTSTGDVPVTPPGADAPKGQPDGTATTDDEIVATGATEALDSRAGNLLLPGLLLVGLLALASAVVSQVMGRRGGGAW